MARRGRPFAHWSAGQAPPAVRRDVGYERSTCAASRRSVVDRYGSVRAYLLECRCRFQSPAIVAPAAVATAATRPRIAAVVPSAVPVVGGVRRRVCGCAAAGAIDSADESAHARANPPASYFGFGVVRCLAEQRRRRALSIASPPPHTLWSHLVRRESKKPRARSPIDSRTRKERERLAGHLTREDLGRHYSPPTLRRTTPTTDNKTAAKKRAADQAKIEAIKIHRHAIDAGLLKLLTGQRTAKLANSMASARYTFFSFLSLFGFATVCPRNESTNQKTKPTSRRRGCTWEADKVSD